MKPTEQDIINDYRGGPKALMILLTILFIAILLTIISILW